MTDQVLWYVSRATGLVGLLLLTAAVVLGALGGARSGPPGWPRFVVGAVHRNVSLLALAFLAVHVAAAVVDPYAGIGWLDAVLPFGSVYKAFWLGLGAVAGDLFLAVLATSLLRVRIGARWWRAVHWATYACWPLAVAHGLGTGGADSRLWWVLAVTAACVVAVVLAVGWRITAVHPDTRARSGERVGP